MGIFDRIAAAAAEPKQAMPDRELAQLEAAPAPTLTPEKIDERISRPPEPTAPMPPKPPEIETGAQAAPGGARGEMGLELGRQAPEGLPAREPLNQHMIDERGLPQEAMATPPGAALAQTPTPTEPVPAVGKPPEAEVSTTAEGTGGAQMAAVKAAPTFKDKLGKLGSLAKKIGVPLLHLIQAGAYGYAGIDKPTALQEMQARQAKLKETEEGRKFISEQSRLDKEFAATMDKINRNYQKTRDEEQAQRDIAAARQANEYKMKEITTAAREAKGTGAVGQGASLDFANTVIGRKK